LFQNLMTYMGIEPDRLHFSWISSAESTKFVQVVNEITDRVKALGPNTHFIKEQAKVA
jgi:coenzyme F420-reducing hydrogenase delta subunit